MSETEDFIRNARTKCAMSIRNTAVGDWLGDALRRLEQADAENEKLRGIIDRLTAKAPATASLAVFICSRCGEPADTVYQLNEDQVCSKCVIES
jgi:formylmethanofuran dehydrogenase subunit E